MTTMENFMNWDSDRRFLDLAKRMANGRERAIFASLPISLSFVLVPPPTFNDQTKCFGRSASRSHPPCSITCLSCRFNIVIV